MKKLTLAALTVLMATGSAHAYTVFDNTKESEYGTKLDLDGSLRIMWRSTAYKNTPEGGQETRNHENQAVQNNGSRFGFRITQYLGNDVYALGRMQFRIQGTAPSQHNFDHLYTHYAFAGIGHKAYGELTFGNIYPFTDYIKRTDLPNTLSLSDGLLPSLVRNGVQYSYKGIKGLELAAYYGGKNERRNNGLKYTFASDGTNKRKDIWGVGGIYKWDIDDKQKATFATAFVRERFHNADDSLYHRSTYAFNTDYTYGATTLGLDLEQRVTRDWGVTAKTKRTESELRTVLYHKLTDDLRAYTMYAYTTDKATASSESKIKRHKYMLGAEYFIVPKYLKTFVEWQTVRRKDYRNDNLTRKRTDNQTVIGLRAYW